MINKVIKRNKENTPHFKGTLTIELLVLLVHSTFFNQSTCLICQAKTNHLPYFFYLQFISGKVFGFLFWRINPTTCIIERSSLPSKNFPCISMCMLKIGALVLLGGWLKRIWKDSLTCWPVPQAFALRPCQPRPKPRDVFLIIEHLIVSTKTKNATAGTGLIHNIKLHFEGLMIPP